MLIRDRQLITYSKGVLIDGTSRFASTYEFRNCLVAEVGWRGRWEGGSGRRIEKDEEREKEKRKKEAKGFASK